MLVGFNHDVRHAGRVYHLQTEDSGEPAARVTSHLFLAGAVVASRTSSYEDLVGEPGLATKVRKIMEEQHKELLRRLVAGEFDGGAGGR
jgi:hypothetical protein